MSVAGGLGPGVFTTLSLVLSAGVLGGRLVGLGVPDADGVRMGAESSAVDVDVTAGAAVTPAVAADVAPIAESAR